MDKLSITTGLSRYDKDWKVQQVSWDILRERLKTPARTAESMAEYAGLTKDARLKIKDVGGFVGGPMEHDGERNNASCKTRSVIAIDVDGAASHIPDVEKIHGILEGLGYCYVLHSTHSSTPEWPRVRVVMPLDRIVSAEEYTPIALRICSYIGLDVTDPTTAQAARIMFWPSCSKDAEYIYMYGGAVPVSADDILGTYVDWRNAEEWPGLSEAVKRAQRRKGITGDMASGTATDPTQKEGIVGAFCSVFSVDDAIMEFGLPYRSAGHGRYTYTGGSSYGGAVVYGGGRWLYSNHATDPCSMQLCNAFDLVRVHRFGSMDYATKEDTPVNRTPSYKAMAELAEGMGEVKTRMIMNTVKGSGFDDVDIPAGTQPEAAPAIELSGAPEGDGAPVETPSGDPAWMAAMDTQGKNLKASPNNFALILENDTRIAGRIAKDTFSNRKVVREPLPWDALDEVYPREWNDADNDGLALWFSQVWKIHTGSDNQLKALGAYLNNHTFHPVREWLASLAEWDGVPRLERVFVDWLGAADTELNRAVTRKHMVAAIRRVMQPGCKYDQVLTLVGPEGTGKSTIISVLANGWGMDSAIPVGDKDAYQNLPGHWLIEMGELNDYETKSVALYKAFISSSTDRYRPAYGHETVAVPRQSVFFATTNEPGFLKGKTGNRRFWVMECPGAPEEKKDGIFNGELETLVPQIWAEALHYFRKGEQLILCPRLAAQMREVQKGHEGTLLDDNINIIREFILMAKPSNWMHMSVEEKKLWYRGRPTIADPFAAGLDCTFYHEYICVKEISMVVFGQYLSSKSRYEDENLYYICDHMDCLERTDKARRFGSEIGPQKAYKVIRSREGETVEDLPLFEDIGV